MSTDRSQRIETLYHAALSRPPEERSAYLRELCGPDDGLRQEVESVLSQASAASGLLAPAAVGIQAKVPGSARALPANGRIGIYLLRDRIGSGGMGDVFLARDTKLGRDVAIKMLPTKFSDDRSRLIRVEREAKVLASLNHPNIGAIYGLEMHDGIPALVLELVDGPTLADRIANGPIPFDEALPIARQIATALAAAHEQGIIHRDLKPANIKLRPDGTVKVLDFGLAKAMDVQPSSDDLPNAATVTLATSSAGTILGTAAYMSPEQASGKSVDKRSDIWSFGVVFLEMLTGRPVFGGETVTEVLAAVLRAEPDWTSLPSDTPEVTRRLLRRCLVKDRKDRLDSAFAVRLELDEALSPTAAAGLATTPRRSRAAAMVAASAIGGALIAALAVWGSLRTVPQTPGSPARFSITLPTALPLRLSLQAAARDFAVAPDGSFIVYRAGNDAQLAIRWLDRLEPVPIAGAEHAVMPFVSPDGRWIGFAGEDFTLKKVPVTGGAPVTLASLPAWPRGATWADDGNIIIGTNSANTGLIEVPGGGGEPRVLTKPDRTRGDEGHLLPAALPGGRSVLFTIGAADPRNAQVALLNRVTGTYTTLLKGARDAQYVQSGHLIYQSGLGMSAIRFDLARGTTVGAPVRILDGLAIAPTSTLNVTVTNAGTMVMVPRQTAGLAGRTLAWVDRQGQELPIEAPVRPYESVRLSPDGTQAAVSIRDQENDIWLWSLPRKTLTRLTFDPDIDVAPVWAPEGRRIVFASARAGAYNLYARDIDAGTSDVRLTVSANTQVPTSMSPDGTYVIGHEVGMQTKSDLVRFALTHEPRLAPAPPEFLVQTPLDEWNAEVSPDGRLIAYQSFESGRTEVYVRPYPPTGGTRWQVSQSGGAEPAWTRGGRELTYLDVDRRLTSVSIDATGSTLRTSTPLTFAKIPYARPAQWRSYDVTADGQRFLVMKQEKPGSDVPDAGPGGFVVVQNWFEELKRLTSEQ